VTGIIRQIEYDLTW